jgi:hypothetical protein
LPVNRRLFLKYAGVTAAIVGASALGFDYLLKSPVTSPSQTSTSSTAVHDMAPPVIRDFHWQPTRVINQKLYDATVSFSVEDRESAIADVDGMLEAHAPNLLARAYPPEPSRNLQLDQSRTSDRLSDYSAHVVDLKGGKYYRATIRAKDSFNNETESQFETPYVRELENIAARDKYLVGAIYLPWWENPCTPDSYCHWDVSRADFASGTTPLGTPLLGLYNSDDPMVIARQFDWATGYGIDFLLCEFYKPSSASHRFTPLFEHPMIGDVRIALSYVTNARLGGPTEDIRLVDLNDPATYSTLESDFEYIARAFFSHPSYLKIADRPVVQIYFTFALRNEISVAIARLRKRIKELGFDVYLIGDEASARYEPDPKRIKSFDAISFCNDILPTTYEPMSPEEVRKEYSRWQSAAHAAGVELVPFAYPGYDDTHLKDRPQSYGYVPRNTEFLSYTLKNALQFADRNGMVGIYSFNDWGEGTFVEPSVEDGFKYLQTLSDTLAGH